MSADAKLTTVLITASFVFLAWFFRADENLAYSYFFGDGVEYYGHHYGVLPENVHIEKEPHDCVYVASPFGKKFCHYEKAVTFEDRRKHGATSLEEFGGHEISNRYVFVTYTKVQE
jgi:hypothetical protein